MVGRCEVDKERGLACEWRGTENAEPLPSVVLELMGKPLVAAAEHSHVALLKCTHVWS